MPVMNKMRDSMPVVFAGLAAIFLLMIIFEWGGQGTIFSDHPDAQTMGTVNGDHITQKMYNDNLQMITDQMKTKYKTPDLNEQQQTQAESDAWDRCITQVIIQRSIKDLGIEVTDQDIRDEIFDNPPADVRRQFTDSTGQFHAREYIKALQDPRNDSLVRRFEAATKEQIEQRKWQETMMTFIPVSNDEMQERFRDNTAKATIELLKFSPTMAEQAEAQKLVTDQEMQSYYDSHKWKYDRPEQRKFKFVPFQIQPSRRDTVSMTEAAEAVRRRLVDAEPSEIDTVVREILMDYAPDADPSKIAGARELPPGSALAPGLDTAKAGDAVVADVAGRLAVVRVVSVSDSGLPSFHIRHIAIMTRPNTIDSAMKSAQALYAQLQSGANFAELAHANSGDFRSAAKGGDMGWVALPSLPPGAVEAVQKAKDGDILAPFAAQGSVEILQVLGRARRSMVGYVIPLMIKPSGQTDNMIKQQATVFRSQAAKNGFDQAAKVAGYHVISDAPAASKKGAPIFQSKSFVNWIFSVDEGELSQPMRLSEGKAYIIAQLTKIIPAGPAPFAEVKEQIAPVVAQRHAAELAAKDAEKVLASVKSAGDLNAGAAAAGDTNKALTLTMGPAESVNGLPSGEYVVNNAAFAMKVGELSNVLKGESGAYIIKVLAQTPATDAEFKAQRETVLRQLLQEKQQRFFMDWLDKKKAEATIVDYRQQQ